MTTQTLNLERTPLLVDGQATSSRLPTIVRGVTKMFYMQVCNCMISLGFLLLPVNAEALPCKIPVFRYALEHWTPAPYEVVIVHRGTLSEKAIKLVEDLKAKAADPKNPGNLKIKSIDVDQGVESKLLIQALGTGYSTSIQSPEIILLYPAESQSGPFAWRGPLTAENVDALLNSPARAQIAEWILDGESLIWVLIGTGELEKDAKTEKLIRSEITRLEQEIVMRDIDVIESEKQFGTDTKVELRLGIKLLVLDRNDPLEQVFAATIVRSEEDLSELGEPIAMPVFGRGRAYLSLAGKGINPKMIEATCRFLIADCSCEVKRLNPGVDLLFSKDWEGSIVGRVSEVTSSSDSTGTTVLVSIPPGQTQQATDEGMDVSDEPKLEKSVDLTVVFLGAGLVLLLGFVLVAIAARMRS